MIESMIIAFSTYSRIPMPHINWTKKGMKYSVCFFPLVGAVTGAAEFLVFLIMEWLGAGPLLKACLFAGIPLIITGGIHMDGYLDTADAIHSWKPREEKLKILDDPHVGAFAVICGAVYIILQVGFASSLTRPATAVVSAGFILSRTFSGLAVVTFPKAKKDGMLRTAADASPSKVKWIMSLETAAAAAFMMIISPAYGAGAVISCIIVYIIYHHTAVSVFGGTTGDIAGWFLQNAELAMLAAAAFMSLIFAKIF